MEQKQNVDLLTGEAENIGAATFDPQADEEKTAILSCKHLVKQYGGNAALAGVDLNLPSGKIIGLLGPNGSGKTTLLKLACGLIPPTSGEILIQGLRPGIESKKIFGTIYKVLMGKHFFI